METAENKYITVAYKLYTILLPKVINSILPFRQIKHTDNMTNNTLSTFRNISSKLTVNSIANTSKKVTSYLCRLAMASV